VKLLQIVALVGQIESDDEIMLGIDRNLRIVGHLMAARRAHQPGLRLGQNLLLEPFPNQLFGLLLQFRAPGLQRRKGPGHVGLCRLNRRLLGIGLIHCRHILGDLALECRIPLGKLLGRDHLLAARYRSYLAPIDRQDFASKCRLLAAELYKSPAYPGNRFRMIFAEIRDGLEHRPHAVNQPEYFDIAPRLTLKPPARAHLVRVTVDIKLQKVMRIVGRPTRRFRLDLRKAQHRKVKAVHKGINHPHRAIRRDHLVQPLRIKRRLIPRLAFDVCHPAPESISALQKKTSTKGWFLHGLEGRDP
jgi:hypothetical protein